MCYHDTVRRKPYPDPINLAIEKLDVPRDTIVAIGDDPRDIEASRRAGVVSIGAVWGAKHPEKLVVSNPDYLVNNVQELFELVRQRFFLKSKVDS